MTPAAVLTPPLQASPGENHITLQALAYITVGGMVILNGQQYSAPLRAGLGYVGIGSSFQLPNTGTS